MQRKKSPVIKEMGIGIAGIFLIWYVFCLPEKLFDVSYSTVVSDRNHELLGARLAVDKQWRFPPPDTVPHKFRTCITTFEDQYFFYHWGVNPLSVGRAIRQNLSSGRIVSGGSTLTMQTIRLARKEKRTWYEKLIEMIWATRLEFRYSKKEILALYASHAPFGGNVVGLEAASWRYFGRSSNNLSWAEAATLAVLPNSPSMIHLSKNRDLLQKKRNRLLKKIKDKALIDLSDYELALAEPLPSEPLPLPQIAPHLVAWLNEKNKGENCISTLDKGLQQQVESILQRWSDEFSGKDIRNISAIVIDIRKNQVLSYCGNVRFESDASGNQVDVIRAPRSTGSILKPLLYCALLQEGELLPDMLLPDIPFNVNGFSPQNFDKQFNGAVHASEALARSLNIPAVHELRTYSVPRFYDFLQRAGLSTLRKPSSYYGLSLILGGAEATLWDIASAYSDMGKTLVRRTGRFKQSIEMGNPSLLMEDAGQIKEYPDELYDAGAVWQTFEAIKEVNRPEEIDWKYIPSMQKIAWKTGTSYGFRDGWAIGITPAYVVGVWAGNANGEGKPGLTGAQTAGPVMFDIFNVLPETSWFEIPYGDLIEAEICPESGHLKGTFCESTDTMLICPKGLKTASCTYHQLVNVSENERYRVFENCSGEDGLKRMSWFVLPPAWEWYYKQHNHAYRSLPPFKSGCGNSGSHQPMQFIYPQMNAHISVPKQLDGSKGKIIFDLAHSNRNAIVYWHLDNDFVGTTETFHQMPLNPEPGKHSITVVDQEGNNLSVTIIVGSI